MLLAAGVGYAVYRHEKKKKKEERRRLELITQNVSRVQMGGPECEDLEIIPITQNAPEFEELPSIPIMDDLRVQKRIFLANLITGMYERASNKPGYSKRWDAHQYELVALKDILKNDQLQPWHHNLEEEATDKYFGVFRMKNREAPDWVVAIRGTSSMDDVFNDIKISLEQLHTSSTVGLLIVVVSELRERTHREGSKVTLTGHSLGASMAMLVARKFALQGFIIDSHLFNPPFATLHALARKLAGKLFDPVFARTKGRIINLKDKLRKSKLFASISFNFLLDNGERMITQLAEYTALAKWSPYLYLNENDPICDSYISHFTKRHSIDSWYSFGSSFLNAISSGNVETFHLMPGAVCCIAQTDHNPLSAHSLEKWIEYDVPVVVRELNLPLEVDEETKELFKIFRDETEDEDEDVPVVIQKPNLAVEVDEETQELLMMFSDETEDEDEDE